MGLTTVDFVITSGSDVMDNLAVSGRGVSLRQGGWDFFVFIFILLCSPLTKKNVVISCSWVW